MNELMNEYMNIHLLNISIWEFSIRKSSEIQEKSFVQVFLLMNKKMNKLKYVMYSHLIIMLYFKIIKNCV